MALVEPSAARAPKSTDLASRSGVLLTIDASFPERSSWIVTIGSTVAVMVTEAELATDATGASGVAAVVARLSAAAIAVEER